MDIGKRILEIRKKNDLSQEQFGNLFHVTRQTVSNWENEKNYPDLVTLVEISNRFDITLDSILKEDAQMIIAIDKAIKSAKVRKVTIFILSVIILFICVAVKVFLYDAFKATPNERRNISTTSVTMYLNLPNATPSRAIIRTFDRETFDGYSTAKLANIWEEIGGNMEGDIPRITQGKNEQVRFVFQDVYHQNVLPDNPPEIVIKEYLNVSALPKDDSVYEYEASTGEGNKGKIREVRDTLVKGSEGYFYIFDDALGCDSAFGEAEAFEIAVCLLEVYYTIEGREYVSTTALYH